MRGKLVREQGGGPGEGVMSEGGARQEVGVTPSEVPDEEAVEMPGNWGKGDEYFRGSRKGSEDQGKGPSGLSTTDKGKGKEKEVVGEETLQEE